ncbi:MAG: FG-GAP-like repeat-containing protein [Chloroflexota bacterium]
MKHFRINQMAVAFVCLLLGTLLALWVGLGVASADGLCPNNPDPTFSAETPTFDHTEHDDIVSGALAFSDVFRRGEVLFKTVFNECDGKGRPGATGNGTPTERLTGSARDMNRVSALDAGSCAICHNIPRSGGGGDFSTTVFVLAQNLDPQSFLVDGSTGNERSSPILFGAGGVELLAREMTQDMERIRYECLVESQQTGLDVTRPLDTHGVNFGQVTCHPDGAVTISGLNGVDVDSIVKPFHQKGSARSLREFTVNALNHHHGMESAERFGYDRTYRDDFDQDGVLTTNEASLGDVDALTIYQAFLAVPGQVLPDDPAEQARVNNGYDLFVSLNCTRCHVEEMQTYGSDFLEPHYDNPPGTFADQASGFSYNLLTNGAVPRFEPVTPGATSGPMKVRLFSDLKRHIICDTTYTLFCNEQVQQGTAPLAGFMTAKLWGVGNTAPYGHQGNLATLSEAILAHGGESVVERDAFAALSPTDKEDVIKFLKSLQVLPNGATSLVMLQSEVDALNQASQEVIISGLTPGRPVGQRLPLNGGPLVFAVGIVAFAWLQRRRMRYAMPVLVGVVVLSAVLTGLSLAATPPSPQPSPQGGEGDGPEVGPPVARLRVWGLNLPDPSQPITSTLTTGIQPAQGKVPLKVTFNNLSFGDPAPTTFTWDFGDGSPVVITNDLRQVSHTYTMPGVYTVSLTATSAQGSDTHVYPNYVFADTLTPWFSDVTAASGVIVNHSSAVSHVMPFGSGAGWADYDNDGWEDLYVVQNGGRSWLWRNNADGTFSDVATAAGVDNLGGAGQAMAWADYDNDGCQDLIVANFDQKGASGAAPRTRLYHNNCDSTFTDVAATAGLTTEGWRSTTSFAWGDYDNDSLLDLYVVNHTNLSNFAAPPPDGTQDFLYHQNPDHTFTDVTAALLQPLVNTQGAGFAATWVDLDNDGDQDLYVVNDRYVGGIGPDKNILWKNTLQENGVVGFSDWCSQPGQAACLRLAGMGLAVADFNRNGFQDFAISNVGNAHLLSGLASMRFIDVTFNPGVNIGRGDLGDGKSITWGEYALDFNNDSSMDLLEVAGWLTRREDDDFVQPDALFQSTGLGTFTDVTALSGLDDPNRGRVGALADYNQDGWVDWFVGNYGEVGRLFRNDYAAVTGSTNNWLQIQLIGNPASGSNRDAIGARVELRASTGSQVQVVGANVGLGGTNSRILTFGLGSATRADRIRITWPSGQVELFSNVLANQYVIQAEP